MKRVRYITDNYIFILGIGRTGSKIYMNFLKKNENITVLPELKFDFPFQKDIMHYYKKNHRLRSDGDVENFLNDLYQGNVKSSAWNQVRKDIDILDREHLKELINASERQPKDVLESIIRSNMQIKGKTVGGAKFPVAVTKMDQIFTWFPTSKIIHLTRGPHASVISHARQFTKKSSGLFGALKYKIMVLHGILEYRKASRVHTRFKDRENYCLSRFEDLINEPETSIRKICEFLDIEFSEEMLSPPAVDSSYKREKKIGFDKKTIDRWKENITPFEKWMIDKFTGSYEKRFQ
jgi:hypothetical protein